MVDFAIGARRGALALAGLLLAANAEAQDASLTGGAVLERCGSPDVADVNWCVGFVFGVGTVAADGVIDKGVRVCPPSDLTSESSRLMVISYLERDAALRDLPGVHAVWYAFRKEFPCP